MPCYCRETGDEYAVKIVRSNVNVNEEVRMLNECQGHPNILELIELLKDERYIYIVTELIDGTELHDYKGVSVDDAKYLFNQMADAIHFMHSKNIVHRDIKFENILISNSHPKTVTIIDFGFATKQRDNTVLTKTCFTLDYVAPEILTNVPYTRKCDIWSLGVTLYLLLCGDTPFGTDDGSPSTDKNIAQTTAKIESGAFNLSYSWSKISSSGKDLIRRMLVVNPDDRLKIEEVVNHEWLVNYRKCNNIPSTLTCSSYNTSTSTKTLFNKKMDNLSNAFDDVLVKINKKNQIESNEFAEEIINNNYKEDANNFSLIISDDDDDDATDTKTVICNDSIVSELWDEDFYGFEDSDDFYGFEANEIKIEIKLIDLIEKSSKPMYTTSLMDETKNLELNIKETKKPRTTRTKAPIEVTTRITRKSVQTTVEVKPTARATRKSAVKPKATTEVVKRNTRGRKVIPVETIEVPEVIEELIVEKPIEKIVELRRTGRIKKQVITISPDDFLSWNDEGEITFDSIKAKDVQPGRIRRGAKRRNEIDDRDWLNSSSKRKK